MQRRIGLRAQGVSRIYLVGDPSGGEHPAIQRDGAGDQMYFGAGLLRGLNSIGLEHFPRANEVHMDATVLLVSLALALVAGFFVGLFPIASVSTIRINDALHEDSRTGTTGKKTQTVRQLLVAAQIGFAFALLVGAALFLASFRLLLQVSPGFQPNGVLTASVALPNAKYAGPEARRKFMDRALHIRFIVRESEFRRVHSNHRETFVLVALVPGLNVRKGSNAVHASVVPEIDKHDPATQLAKA